MLCPLHPRIDAQRAQGRFFCEDLAVDVISRNTATVQPPQTELALQWLHSASLNLFASQSLTCPSSHVAKKSYLCSGVCWVLPHFMPKPQVYLILTIRPFRIWQLQFHVPFVISQTWKSCSAIGLMRQHWSISLSNATPSRSSRLILLIINQMIWRG